MEYCICFTDGACVTVGVAGLVRVTQGLGVRVLWGKESSLSELRSSSGTAPQQIAVTPAALAPTPCRRQCDVDSCSDRFIGPTTASPSKLPCAATWGTGAGVDPPAQIM